MSTETLRRAERDGLITRHLDAEHIEAATLYELKRVMVGRSRSYSNYYDLQVLTKALRT
ncbi:MAG TPA: hypothetical protein VG346_02910 [Acidimicrobiales bacterium]|nr:hypothetical protein [Acidimicrobiales bacterium]